MTLTTDHMLATDAAPHVSSPPPKTWSGSILKLKTWGLENDGALTSQTFKNPRCSHGPFGVISERLVGRGIHVVPRFANILSPYDDQPLRSSEHMQRMKDQSVSFCSAQHYPSSQVPTRRHFDAEMKLFNGTELRSRGPRSLASFPSVQV
ncbi:hypothetical protein NA56DRAFT_709884 [Hyaloscypha hepaticicola]|uniref:Uncharacterized protein n=1 Tax=Hyaloscypha hepaticicola TaxID=2082293 RepID=A0A2J6PN46_9HELO|nr:hypothetical protein NA56DRAFT_709884 [Hyaloscypha hepaticicola]